MIPLLGIIPQSAMNTNEIRRGRARRAPEKNTMLLMVDLLLLACAFMVSVMVIKQDFRFLDAMSLNERREMLLSVGFGIFFFWGFEMYSIVLLKPSVTFVTVVLSAIYTFVCTFLTMLLLSGKPPETLLLAVGCGSGFALLLMWRMFLYYYYKHKPHRQKMLMIEKMKDDNSRVRRMKYACLSRFDAWYEQVNIDDIECVKKFIEERFPAYDVICLMETVPYEVRDLFLNAGTRMGKDFYVVPMMYEMNFAKVKLASLDDVMVFHLQPNQINDFSMAIKRAMDILLALTGLAIAAIPMGIIALTIKLTSPGPVFYKQTRLTKDKRAFEIYKFRSMVQNAEAKSGPMLALKDDPRVTPVGRWLRKLRLDELPQLINILKGDMSVVGPRPERPFFVEQYEKTIENYDKRFTVRAGLRALSHVYGRYSTDAIDRTRYDLLYVQNYSLLLDIRIILQTSRTIFLSDAAEGVWTTDRRESARTEQG